MKRRTLFKTAAVVIGVPALVVTALLLYLNFADLSGWRDTVAGLASDAIGRELRINGEFQPEIGFTTRVVASDVTLANADWSSEPQMVSVDRLEGEIDLLSILFGPITICDVEITGGRVLFEVDPDGQFNWNLGSGDSDSAGGRPSELVISHALLSGLKLVYTPPHGRVLDASLTSFEITEDGKGMLDLDLVGSFRGEPVEISGRLGTFIGLINAGAVEHDLTGRFADTDFSLRGTIGDLGSLAGVDGAASVNSPDVSRVTAALELPSITGGPLTVKASVKPSAPGSDIDLDVASGDLSARLTGTVDSLTRPKFLDATLTASGPSIRTVGALTGVADLPDEEFSVSGGVRWEGFPVTFKELEIVVGENTLSADGVLGAPPQMLGTDFTIRGGGPNASSIGALAGIDLPDDSFAVSGRVLRVEDGLQVEQVEAHVGRTILRVEGRVGDPPDYAGTTLTLHAEGPSMAQFKNLLGKELPAEPVAIDGRLVEENEAIALEGVSARLGRTTLQLDGHLKTAKGLSGSTLHLRAKGPDATQIAWLAGVDGVPHEAWTLEGGLTILDSGYRLDGLSATVGSLTAHVDGLLSATRGLVGTDLQIHFEDTDLMHPASIAGLTGLPRDAISIDTRLRLEETGYRIDGFKATFGDMGLEADGLIGAPPELEGTQLQITARGPRLSSLDHYLDQTGLPASPFSVSGNVHVTDGAYELDTVAAEVDGNRVTVNGSVVPVKGLRGTDLKIEVAVPDLRHAGRLATELANLPELPDEPLTLTTRLAIDATGYQIDNLEGTLAKARVNADGRVGPPPGFIGTDLTINGDGPDASLFRALTGVTIPVAPFEVRGRVQRTDSAFLFDRVAVQLGGHSITLHGSLGEAPRMVGTDLELFASGDGTALVAGLTGFRKLPDQPFKISGHFHGTPEKFTTDELNIVLGESDVRGSLGVDITDKPAVTIKVVSNRLDLSPYMKPLNVGADTHPEEEAAPGPTSGGTAISNEPIDFSPLQRADADVDITVGTLQLPLKVFRDVKLGAKLADGRLEIERFAAVGQNEGRIDGNVVLEPTTGGRHLLRTRLEARQLRLEISGSQVEREEQPPINIDVHLEAGGATPHELAASANGSLQLVIGKGVMDSRVLDVVTADILLTLLTAFNPFAKEDAATELQCGVALMTIDNGLATLEPMAFQSDKMTLLGKGKINLDSEKLDLEWVTKPRKGIGISASMITNPYIKLGGTLSEPAVQLKGMEAVTSTGVAVATFGVSLVAKGMFDRITAEKKVCKQALEEIGRQSENTSKKSKKKQR